jgi:hypothetical protein
MAKNKRFDRAILANFEEGYETSHEDAALQNRGEFIRKFPLKRLKVNAGRIRRRPPGTNILQLC